MDPLCRIVRKICKYCLMSETLLRLTQYVNIVAKTSFKCKKTEKLYGREFVKKFKSIARRALTRLRILETAPTLEALASIPGNRFEALKGERKGRYSIRINDQWRICFKWEDGDAFDVEIVDYH